MSTLLMNCMNLCFVSNLGVHSLHNSDPRYVCVNADGLLDYCPPSSVYKAAELSVVSLHHLKCALYDFRHRADSTRNKK